MLEQGEHVNEGFIKKVSSQAVTLPIGITLESGEIVAPLITPYI